MDRADRSRQYRRRAERLVQGKCWGRIYDGHGDDIHGGQTLRYGIAEYSDAPSSSVVDDYDSASFTTTTTPATASLTTTGANRTIISVIATNLSATSIAPAGGESERQEVDARLQFQDEFAATAGSHGASWTLGATQPGVYAILALKPATTTTKYVKILADSSAASATGVEVVVYNAPAGSNYVTGTTRYGSVNAQAFEASLESGNAVLKVLASDVGCDGLACVNDCRRPSQKHHIHDRHGLCHDH